MASFDVLPHYAPDTTPLAVVAGGTVYSSSFSLTPQVSALGLYALVSTVGAGTAQYTVQTAVADALDSDPGSWLDLDAVVVGVDLTNSAIPSRMRIADGVMDKVRLKVIGDATAAGSITLGFASDRSIEVL